MKHEREKWLHLNFMCLLAALRGRERAKIHTFFTHSHCIIIIIFVLFISIVLFSSHIHTHFVRLSLPILTTFFYSFLSVEFSLLWIVCTTNLTMGARPKRCSVCLFASQLTMLEVNGEAE